MTEETKKRKKPGKSQNRYILPSRGEWRRHFATDLHQIWFQNIQWFFQAERWKKHFSFRNKYITLPRSTALACDTCKHTLATYFPTSQVGWPVSRSRVPHPGGRTHAACVRQRRVCHHSPLGHRWSNEKENKPRADKAKLGFTDYRRVLSSKAPSRRVNYS